MKKFWTTLLCLALLTTTFAACTALPAGNQNDTTAETTAASDETTAETTAASDETTAEDETTVADDGETTDDGEPEGPVAGDINIGTPEELMAFNKAVNEDMEDFMDATIAFTADIDMTGYEWTPLDSWGLEGVTFEGNGHTISNLKFVDHEPPKGTDPGSMGSGFVGVNTATMSFRNLTFENASVTAYERHVGCIIGINVAGDAYVDFENVHVKGFKADGWMDCTNDHFEETHPIAFRLAGFVGNNMAGFLTFTNCSASDLTLSGFHNLAGFVGYDASGTVDEYAFENCKVEECKFTFSYCLSDSYTVDMPRRFVSVFYNGANWIHNVDAVVEMGNEYANVYYLDWTDNNAEYEASDFRSWTQEEKDAIDAGAAA